VTRGGLHSGRGHLPLRVDVEQQKDLPGESLSEGLSWVLSLVKGDKLGRH
jgi:hypothetical protein